MNRFKLFVGHWKKIREDAKKHMRPIGMHLSFIVTEYFKEKK